MALPPGSFLNDEKYVTGRDLGRGGFGITYVALDQKLGLRVAVKECLPQRDAWRGADGVSVQWSVPVHEQETAMENFVREARKMAKIDQIPGVVRVREYFYDNDTAYIVMDYVDGETLAARLRRTGPLSAEECFRLLRPVMDALEQAHRRGLVHRDISPNNIMIARTEDGGEQVWLLDLGAAKDLGTRLSAPNVSAETRIVGTSGYTPSEQYDPDGSIGPWTDVYAMSAVFVRCMTGQRPQSPASRTQEDAVPELLRPAPGPVSEILLKGLAQKSKERYQTMSELRDALEEAVKDTAGTREFDDKTEVLPQDRISERNKVTPEPRPKPTLAILIALVLAVCVFGVVMFLRREPPAEIVASGECGESVSWTLDENGLLTISGAGNMESYSNAPLNTPWLERNDAITRIKILEGVTSIGQCAFYQCGNLQSVEIPDSVTEIKWGAFNSCASLPEITLPKHLTLMEGFAFDGCGALESIVIPNGVTAIGDDTFRSCASLESVKIPDSVVEIGEAAFYDCSALSSITIPDGVTEIKDYAFRGCSALTDAVIPDSVTVIALAAFNGCNHLSNITIPKNLTVIGGHAFSRCAALPNIAIPDSVTEIGETAFYECASFSNIIIPKGVTEIKESAFYGCSSLKSVTIPASVLEIKESAFYGCSSLESVTVPFSVWRIGDNAFANCASLTTVKLSQGVTNLLASVFQGCVSLKSIDIPEGVLYINPYMFYGCSSLESVTLPDSTRVIGARVFAGCNSLESVSVPSDTQIAPDAFDANTTVIRR